MAENVSVTFIHISITYVIIRSIFVYIIFMHSMIILPCRLEQVAAVGETVDLLKKILQWFVN